MKNIELAKLTLKRIDAEPELFDMQVWGAQDSCGTTACLAGHAMLAAGYSFREDQGGAYYYRHDGSVVNNNALEARELLGMTDQEYYFSDSDTCMRLFYMSDSAAALKRFRSLIPDE